nr:MAG TPA: hypothetical protein [Caudoviricetes sp.]
MCYLYPPIFTTFGALVISYRIGLYHQHCKGSTKNENCKY